MIRESITPPAGQQSSSVPWRLGLEPAGQEYDRLPITRIEGKLPAGLRGTLYRNGPGKNEVHGTRTGHWFDGDGMIAAFRFEEQGVSYTNRFVRTKYFVNEEKAQRVLYGGFATRAPAPFPLHLMRGMKNPANTNVVPYDGKLLALWEGGRPWAVDPHTLETLGEESFHGTLPRDSFFSAHPHRDRRHGGFINVAPKLGAKPALQPWRMTLAGRVQKLAPIALKKAYMVHDFGLTASKIVILGAPFYLEPQRLPRFLLGLGTMLDCFAWHPEEPMLIYVADPAGQAPVRRYELPAAMLFHVANAYDEGGDVIVDAMLYDDDAPLRLVADGFAGRTPTAEPGCLWRIRLGPNGEASRERLSGLGVDFARINDRYDALPYRFAYPLVFEKGSFSSSKIAKIDTATGESRVHDFGAGCFAGEPVFVPNPQGTSEDDGWLLSVVYDARDHHSFLAIVPATQFGKEDTRAHLPFHIPFGFHGNWLP